jgi:hypothetical protein
VQFILMIPAHHPPIMETDLLVLLGGMTSGQCVKCGEEEGDVLVFRNTFSVNLQLNGGICVMVERLFHQVHGRAANESDFSGRCWAANNETERGESKVQFSVAGCPLKCMRKG